MNTELQHAEDLAPVIIPPNPMAMVAAAIDKGMDPEKILDFIERVKRTEAAEGFAKSLAKFQAECPQILKTRQVKFSGDRVAYKFASYDDIDKVIAPLLRDCGIVLSFSFDEPKDGRIMGTCRVRVGNHMEPTTLPVPFTKGQNTNAAQDLGATITYAKRYLICAALNIRITDNLEEDTDGISSADFLNPAQVAEVEAGLKACVDAGQPIKSLARWLDWVQPGLKTVKEMPQRFLQVALNDLARRAQAKGEQK